jgi:predicted GNAT family N-acyltransferase
MKVKTFVTSNLKKKQIFNICALKDTCWKYGIKNQFKWFKNNVKSNDFHNLLYDKNSLIGYTLLRKRTCSIKKKEKIFKKKYFYFDTLILKNSYRGKYLSFFLMKKNCELIKKKNKFAFLICNNKLVKYYKKFDWEILNYKFYKILDHKKKAYGMIYNKKLLKNLAIKSIDRLNFEYNVNS